MKYISIADLLNDHFHPVVNTKLVSVYTKTEKTHFSPKKEIVLQPLATQLLALLFQETAVSLGSLRYSLLLFAHVLK
jgi:hypothetical protein